MRGLLVAEPHSESIPGYEEKVGRDTDRRDTAVLLAATPTFFVTGCFAGNIPFIYWGNVAMSFSCSPVAFCSTALLGLSDS